MNRSLWRSPRSLNRRRMKLW